MIDCIKYEKKEKKCKVCFFVDSDANTIWRSSSCQMADFSYFLGTETDSSSPLLVVHSTNELEDYEEEEEEEEEERNLDISLHKIQFDILLIIVHLLMFQLQLCVLFVVHFGETLMLHI
jgi:hypothetical protein